MKLRTLLPPTWLTKQLFLKITAEFSIGIFQKYVHKLIFNSVSINGISHYSGVACTVKKIRYDLRNFHF